MTLNFRCLALPFDVTNKCEQQHSQRKRNQWIFFAAWFVWFLSPCVLYEVWLCFFSVSRYYYFASCSNNLLSTWCKLSSVPSNMIKKKFDQSIALNLAANRTESMARLKCSLFDHINIRFVVFFYQLTVFRDVDFTALSFDLNGVTIDAVDAINSRFFWFLEFGDNQIHRRAKEKKNFLYEKPEHTTNFRSISSFGHGFATQQKKPIRSQSSSWFMQFSLIWCLISL